MEDTDSFCSKCGRHAAGWDFRRPAPYNGSSAPHEPLDRLCCELAYSGTLFWVPLLLCPKAKDAKFYANQGLWLLILAVLSCTLIRGLSVLNDFFSGGVIGVFSGAVYSLVFIVFLAVMLYLAWNAVNRAMAVHRGEEPEPILFFEKLRIIK